MLSWVRWEAKDGKSLCAGTWNCVQLSLYVQSRLVAEKGREVGIPTPFNDAVIEAMRAVDAGTLPQGAEHVDRVLRAAGR